MALTDFQREVCRLLAHHRAARHGYVAGGAALNTLLGGARLSDDVVVFHDTETAVAASWEMDRTLLDQNGFTISLLRQFPTFIEAEIARDAEALVMQWAYDSAFRFFPLQEHPDLGYTLHPMDAATNKVLAFVGRVEPRDWIDAMTCSDQLQHLGFLCWAACGKDPGYSPLFLLDEAARSARFSMPEFQKLAFDGAPPDPRELGTKWRAILLQARAIAEILPPEEIGKVVLKHDGELFRGEAVQLQDAVHNGALKFHAGAIGGVWPQIKS